MKRADLIKQTWTCFEHAIRTHTQIMRGRHLDQILMCSVYIISKATGQQLKFEDIMKCYRTQRNAASHVYRSVLIKNCDRGDVPLTPVDPNVAAAPSMEDRGDIIRFYNAVFVETMGAFAEQFSSREPNENASLLLSPVPKIQNNVSPRKRISQRLRVYVSPLNPALKVPSARLTLHSTILCTKFKIFRKKIFLVLRYL
jgi:retinoblastoma-like protein 1